MAELSQPPHIAVRGSTSDQRKKSLENWQPLKRVTQQQSNRFPSGCEVKWELQHDTSSPGFSIRLTSYLTCSHIIVTQAHTHTRNTQWLSDDTINPTCLSPFLSHTHAHNYTEACANRLPGSFCTSSVGNPINFHSREQHNETHPRLSWLALSHTHTHAHTHCRCSYSENYWEPNTVAALMHMHTT